MPYKYYFDCLIDYCYCVLQAPEGSAAPEPNQEADVADTEQMAEAGFVPQTHATGTPLPEADAMEDVVEEGARMRAEGPEGASHTARPFKVLLPFFYHDFGSSGYALISLTVSRLCVDVVQACLCACGCEWTCLR